MSQNQNQNQKNHSAALTNRKAHSPYSLQCAGYVRRITKQLRGETGRKGKKASQYLPLHFPSNKKAWYSGCCVLFFAYTLTLYAWDGNARLRLSGNTRRKGRLGSTGARSDLTFSFESHLQNPNQSAKEWRIPLSIHQRRWLQCLYKLVRRVLPSMNTEDRL